LSTARNGASEIARDRRVASRGDMRLVIASAANQSSGVRNSGLRRRLAPRSDAAASSDAV